MEWVWGKLALVTHLDVISSFLWLGRREAHFFPAAFPSFCLCSHFITHTIKLLMQSVWGLSQSVCAALPGLTQTRWGSNTVCCMAIESEVESPVTSRVSTWWRLALFPASGGRAGRLFQPKHSALFNKLHLFSLMLKKTKQNKTQIMCLCIHVHVWVQIRTDSRRGRWIVWIAWCGGQESNSGPLEMLSVTET